LEELANDEADLPRRLNAAMADSKDAQSHPTEAEFRYDLNADAMATEKLAEGIRNFVADQIKLEQLIGSQ
jgi:transaldolase